MALKLKLDIEAQFKKDLARFLKDLKPSITEEDRAHEEDHLPGWYITIGAERSEDGIQWGWQTGDNSYTGGAYGYPSWASVTLHRRSNTEKLASEVVDQLFYNHG